ncbi:uncharacterized protein K460DRAFT_325429 [Cucurbitaria berberidis CBS 394.84]|uniref:Uncharacterized protein n=1 Tax=Cucurbitaria berberidis CBS 394.84 TaxID=1168544 RepID=A0A9P4GUB9_9PLEO|nr:uncharacterized protein K460DRAFT_325429 [Cucurbitaria berberidis CBS 394.84]KAF1851972.1 hypothetical protein K460DRAFT_325429 [Cucurbitaria berberidis CBS 394.84]
MATVSKRDSMDATVESLEAKLGETQLSQSATPKRPIGLTDLPPSVRNSIYKYALDTELVNVGKPNVSYSHTIKDGELQFKSSRPPFPINTSLFYVNKQISRETLQYFYSKNLFIRFEIYTPDARHAKTMLEDSGLLFSTAAPSLLEQSKQHALELVLVEKNSSQKRASVMFPAQYLPRLINFLDQASRATGSWAPVHSLFINVMNTYDFAISRLQGDLLELFRLLSNLGGVTVDAKNLLPRYAEGLQANMTASAFTADNLLSSVVELADLADEAREKGEYKLAFEYGQAVIVALTYGYLTHSETLHSQPEEFAKSVQRLRWKTELGIGIALSLQHREITSIKSWLSSDNPTTETKQAARDLLLAESSVSKALSLSTDAPSPAENPWFLSLPVELIPPNKPTWFTDRERAQTWYALGTIHTALGEYVFGAGDLERALGLWGEEGGESSSEGKEKVEKAFEKARGGIDGDAENMWVGKVRPGSGLKKASVLARSL